MTYIVYVCLFYGAAGVTLGFPLLGISLSGLGILGSWEGRLVLQVARRSDKVRLMV